MVLYHSLRCGVKAKGDRAPSLSAPAACRPAEARGSGGTTPADAGFQAGPAAFAAGRRALEPDGGLRAGNVDGAL
jgi:hypothetical protein